jgi:hypothetical protein
MDAYCSSANQRGPKILVSDAPWPGSPDGTIETPPLPTLDKAQPMAGGECSVLCVFDKVRMFNQPASKRTQ